MAAISYYWLYVVVHFYFSFQSALCRVEMSFTHPPGPIPWLVRSSDVMPLDIFLLGDVKCHAFRTSVNDIGTLRAAIVKANINVYSTHHVVVLYKLH
jgi:hypothetical protein